MSSAAKPDNSWNEANNVLEEQSEPTSNLEHDLEPVGDQNAGIISKAAETYKSLTSSVTGLFNNIGEGPTDSERRAAIATIGAAGLAGCSTFNNNTQNTATDTPATTPTNPPTETETETATETDQPTETKTPEPEWQDKEMWQLMPQFETKNPFKYRKAEEQGMKAAQSVSDQDLDTILDHALTTVSNNYNWQQEQIYEDTKEASTALTKFSWHILNKLETVKNDSIILNQIPALVTGAKWSTTVASYETQNGEQKSFIYVPKGQADKPGDDAGYHNNVEQTVYITDKEYTLDGEERIEGTWKLGGDFDTRLWVEENYPEAFEDQDIENTEWDNMSTGIKIGPGIDENYTFGSKARTEISDMQERSFNEFMKWSLKFTNNLGEFRHNNPDSEYQVLKYTGEEFRIEDIPKDRLDKLKTEYE